MIGDVLSLLRDQLDKFLRAAAPAADDGAGDPRVQLLDGAKADPVEFRLNAITLLLVNIEQETGLRSADPYLRTPGDAALRNHEDSLVGPDRMRDLLAQLLARHGEVRLRALRSLGRSDVLAFWFGESDEVTPDFIRQAAIESLNKGETFYSHNLGLPELRGGPHRAEARGHRVRAVRAGLLRRGGIFRVWDVPHGLLFGDLGRGELHELRGGLRR
jgi:hypothetical protein